MSTPSGKRLRSGMSVFAPTMQFLIGVFVFHEAFDRDRAIGFAFIWIALAIFAIDGLLRSRRANAPTLATAPATR